MDIYTIYFTVVALVFIVTSRLATGRKGLKLAVPWLADYLTLNDNEHFSHLQLATMCVLVSVLSCAEFTSDTAQRVEMRIKLLEIYKSLVFSTFVLVGVRLQTPMFLGLWLSFTLKNLAREASYIAMFFYDPLTHNFLSFAVFWTMVAYLWLVQVQWWGVLANMYSTLWNNMLDQLAGLHCRGKPTEVCLREKEVY